MQTPSETKMIVSIPEAAQRLNVSIDSVRRRVRSGVLSASRDARGQWWLELPDDGGLEALPGEVGERIGLGTGTPLQRNERESLIVALEDQIDDLKARLDRCEQERREDAETFRVERDRLLAMIERLAGGKA
jgi:hypothetical protein